MGYITHGISFVRTAVTKIFLIFATPTSKNIKNKLVFRILFILSLITAFREISEQLLSYEMSFTHKLPFYAVFAIPRKFLFTSIPIFTAFFTIIIFIREFRIPFLIDFTLHYLRYYFADNVSFDIIYLFSS